MNELAPSSRRRWLRGLAVAVGESAVDATVLGVTPQQVVEALALRVAGPLLLLPDLLADVRASPSSSAHSLISELDDPPGGWADPWLIGSVHEVLASSAERGIRGAWYTPQSVVEDLVDRVMSRAFGPPRFVIDPTCGGGGFLLGVLDWLVASGVEPDAALRRIGGIDVDASAVDAARLSVAAWGAVVGASSEAVGDAVGSIHCGDQLVAWPDDWPEVDAVIGNPPFATPLRGRPFPEAAQAARLARSDRLGPYADLAAMHLAVCLERVRAGGRVCLVLPLSLLSGRDTALLRSWIDQVAPMSDLWVTKQQLFDASVRVWAPVLDKQVDSVEPEAVDTTPTVNEIGWSTKAAAALGVPQVAMRETARLGSIIESATAGFRDEYYALAEACVERAALDVDLLDPADVADTRIMRIATVGSLDLLSSWWGLRPTRFAKQLWEQPVVDVGCVQGASQRWLEEQRRAKVLVPTQSKVFEPLVDRTGVVAPVTPLVALHADADAVDLVAAVLLAPPVVAWAHTRWFGAAMSVDAIKVAAKDFASFPLPGDEGAWTEAAAIVRSADGAVPGAAAGLACEVAHLMNRAYGGSDEVERWWLARVGPLVASPQ